MSGRRQTREDREREIVAASTLVRPKRSAIGPQMNDSPQPTRNSAKRIEPARPTFAGVAA